MKAMNGFLEKLQLEDTRMMNQEEYDDNRGVITSLAQDENGNYVPFIRKQNVYESSNDVQMNVHKSFKSVHGMFTETSERYSWMWKAKRNRGKTRPGNILRGLISGVAVAFTIFCFYSGIDADYRNYMCAISAICFILLDPFDTIGRWVAVPSRVLASCDIAAWIATDYIFRPGTIRLWLYGTVVVALWILIRNMAWLKSENWSMTSSVEHALTEDPNNQASGSWQGGGKRETRTMLHELGREVSEDDLDTVMKAVFCLGYWKDHQQRTELENQIEDLQEQIIEQDEELAELEDIISGYENAEEEEGGYRILYEQLKQSNERLTASYRELKAHSEELEEELSEYTESGYKINVDAEVEESASVPEADTYVEVIPSEREELKEYVYNLYSEGKSYKQIAEIIGKSKGHAFNLVKEYINENQSDKGDKIISLSEVVNG